MKVIYKITVGTHEQFYLDKEYALYVYNAYFGSFMRGLCPKPEMINVAADSCDCVLITHTLLEK